MSSTAPRVLPGLEGRSVLVAADHAPLCLVLIASGATVLAVGPSETLPSELHDAGTGLPGSLHYRSRSVGWPAVADWIGERHAGIHAAVVGDEPLDDALAPHLVDDAPVVSVGHADAGAGPRCHRVTMAEPTEGSAAVVAFLLSDLARPVTRADLRLT